MLIKKTIKIFTKNKTKKRRGNLNRQKPRIRRADHKFYTDFSTAESEP